MGPRRCRGARRSAARAAAAAVVAGAGLGAAAAPELKIWPAVSLRGEPQNDNFASKNQAMNVWYGGDGKDIVVSLLHQRNHMDVRADDREFAVVWQTSGEELREVQRVPLSCPDVELIVPPRGPFVYEARLELNPYSMHPECACPPNTPCPLGVSATFGEADGSRSNSTLESPTQSHFVTLQNEWEEIIADPAVLGRLADDVTAAVAAAGPPPSNASATAPQEANLACPASRDEMMGTHDVTFSMLGASNITLGGVRGKWCLVRRGGCDETAKVKVCEASGAVGTVIVDHGHSQIDQEIVIRYNRKEKERAAKPVLFIGKREGDALFARLSAGATVSLSVGPTVGGVPPPNYAPGTGVVVHAVSPLADDALRAGLPRKKAYPEIFGLAGWLEASRERDIMYVCLPGLQEVRLYNISAPMTDIPMLGKIRTSCSKTSMHDYHIVEYRGEGGRFTTILVDPADTGNRLQYYDTEDPTRPKQLFVLHADWEADDSGLGHVRPGGPKGRYHFVTWHCSNLYCEKNHGDAVYVLDSMAPREPPKVVKLPMLTQGGFARDVACGEGDGAVCLVTLTWDGMAAIDPGETPNKFRVIASYTDGEFRDDSIPLGRLYLKMYSGAQKVYASKAFPRTFYVEHSDFKYRPLRLGDSLRALQLRDLYRVEVVNYDSSVVVPGSQAYKTYGEEDGEDGEDEDYDDEDDDDEEGGALTALWVFFGCLGLGGCCVVAAVLRRRKTLASRAEDPEENPDAAASPEAAGERLNVVVGRPIGADGPAAAEAAQGHALDPASTEKGDPMGAPSAEKEVQGI